MSFYSAPNFPPPVHTGLASFVGSRLARYKVPKAFIVTDELPRTAYGKVVKGDLVEDWKNRHNES